MQYSKFSIRDLGYLIRASLIGKSIPRIYLNLAIRKSGLEALKGRTIDLGAKSPGSSYYNFLNTKEADLYFCDFYHNENPRVLKINLEEVFSDRLGDFDNILCFNTLEHIYDTQNILSESSKILKKGGRFIGSIPFLYPYHKDPDDFHRYSHSALERLFNENGLKLKRIVAVGSGPFALGFQSIPLPGFFRAIFQSLLFFGDLILYHYYKKNYLNFTLLYFFESEKV